MTLLQPPSDAFNKWLATLPTVAFVAVCGVVLAFFSVAVVLTTMLLGRHLDAAELWPLFTFIGAMLGVAHMGYKVKRETWRPDVVPMDDTSPDGTMPYHVVAQTPDYLSKLPGPVRAAVSAVEARADGNATTPYFPHLAE